MTWKTLKDARLATKCEFTKRLAEEHHFLRLPSGKWTRTLGQPKAADSTLQLVHVVGRVWHLNAP